VLFLLVVHGGLQEPRKCSAQHTLQRMSAAQAQADKCTSNHAIPRSHRALSLLSRTALSHASWPPCHGDSLSLGGHIVKCKKNCFCFLNDPYFFRCLVIARAQKYGKSLSCRNGATALLLYRPFLLAVGIRLSCFIVRSSLSCRQPLAVMQLKGEGSKEWEQRCAWLMSGFVHCIALCELSWHMLFLLCGGV
jgi:hypothetical protein